MNAQPKSQTGIPCWQHGVIFVLACVVWVTRRPDAIFHAQFWAEDGRVWFANAYNLGWWPALLQTWHGYYLTLPRLVAALTLTASLSLAPLVLNGIAIAVGVFPVNLLLSSRSSVWGSLRFRAFMAAVYLALPNSREIRCGISESPWPLALSAFLLLVATAPKGVAGRLFDLSVAVLCGLTGPFCIFLMPIAWLLARRHHERRRWVTVCVYAALSLVQAWGLLVVEPTGRHSHELGASLLLFIRILAGQVYIGALLGSNGLAAIAGSRIFLVLLCAAIGGSAIVITCLIKSTIEMKLFLVFSALLLAASLVASITPNGIPAWESLAPIGGNRYWFFPALAFAWSLLWCLRSQTMPLKAISGGLLLLMCVGIVRDWRDPAFEDMNFAAHEQRFESAPIGAEIIIPENPKGWEMRLVKHR